MKKFREFLMKDNTFILLTVLICAGAMATSTLFATDGVGSVGSVAVTMMLSDALSTGDWGALVGLSGGFLIARVLEGPLVGILDIGGSVMAGISFGVFGLLASTGFGSAVTSNFLFSLFCGAVAGLIMGLVIMGVRKFIPAGVTAGGTDIMMGVGHQLGVWLPPLILISALNYNLLVGIVAAIGGVIFHLRGKGMMGGIILGIFIMAFLIPVVA